jgi:NADPH-dependent 2,4-dienoyl-CoA reductase/sulfur reductase-like enzyme
MSRVFDLVVVGAGPAGMAAAITAKGLGLEVLVVDEQPAPGGQIWRAVEAVATTPEGEAMGPDYRSGAAVAAALRASGVDYAPDTQVWQIEPSRQSWRVFASRDQRATVFEARTVLLAVGAQERPTPFPGWDLPGVMAVGAAQILLKTSRQVPTAPVWIAGCGPLPLLYAAQLMRLGGQLAGFLDTTPRENRRSALPHLPRALGRLGDLLKGLGWTRELRKAGVPIVRHVEEIEALGTARLTAIRYRTRDGLERTAPASALLVHEGVVPNIHPTLALGCAHSWRDDQLCWAPAIDAWGETSLGGLFVAGDGAGIAGARAASLRGELAAIGAARRLGKLEDPGANSRARPARRRLRRELAVRPFLDALFRPRPALFAPRDDTVVCRCEDLTARDIRAAAAGAAGPNQVKAFTRAGMGPCQGRQCGYTVAHLIAAAQGRPLPEVGFYRIRPPLKPVTVGELAALDTEQLSA